MPAIPERWARYYLSNAPSLLTLLAANAAALLVGLRFYLPTMGDVATFLWPLYLDSPMAVFLALASLVTLLPNLGRPPADAATNRPLAFLHTVAFVWLVKYGLWTVVGLALGFDAYFPDIWDFWAIGVTHAGFVLEAYLIPHYGTTTRGALAAALALLLAGDAFDYVLGYHPPLRYDPGLALPAASVALSVLAVGLADRAFDRPS